MILQHKLHVKLPGPHSLRPSYQYAQYQQAAWQKEEFPLLPKQKLYLHQKECVRGE